jgi:hypothetical protein
MSNAPVPRQRSEPRPRKHLMVPGQPRPVYRSTSITTIQRWVLSSLAFVTIEHMAGGLVVAAIFTDPSHPGTRLGLLAVSGGFATVAVSAALLIHQKRLPSPWLALAVVPPLVGAYFCFWS